MSKNKCCVPMCSNTLYDGVPLHSFPNPDKDSERFKEWVFKIGGEIIQLDKEQIYKNRRVCHKHFSAQFIYLSNHLSKMAIPQLQMSGEDNTVLHTFPKPDKELERFKLWTNAIGGEILFLDHQTVFNRRRVCTCHFESKYHTRSKRLSPSAVPTLHLQGAVLHYFPNPTNDPKQFHIWIKKAGLVGEDHNYIFRNRRICRNHFESIYHYPKNRLSRIAIPTLNLSGPMHHFIKPVTNIERFEIWKAVLENDTMEKKSTSTVCEAPTPATPTTATPTTVTPTTVTPTTVTPTTATPASATPTLATSTHATPAPKPPEHNPLQSAPPEDVDPLALDVKSEDEDSDTETHCTEEPVYDETIKENVTAASLANEPGDAVNTNANPVAPTLKNVLTASDAVNIAPQTQAVATQPRVPPKIVLRRVDLKEIKNLNQPPLKLMKTKLPLSVLQRLKLNNQKQVVQPAAQLQQNASTASLTNLPHEIVQKRLLTENMALRKELRTLQKKNKLLEQRLIKLKRTRTDRKSMFDKITEHMSAPAKALFEMQLQRKKKKGRRYSLPGRIIALSIYKASPACYALLSKYFVLPSVRMLNCFVASATTQAATTEINVTKETDTNEPENKGDQDMLLDENKMDCTEDLDLNDYNIDNTFQQEINETSEAVDHIVNEIQAINYEPQSSQNTEDLHQMTDDTSEVQSVELCEGQSLQLADGRIFQLIDGQIVEVVGELEQDELNLPYDETRGTGSIALLSETPLPHDNVSSRRLAHSMSIKPNSLDGRPANVDELCISVPQRSQVGEQATQIKHPHRTQQQHTKHQQTTKEPSSYTDSSRTVTRPVISLKRVATDKEPITSPTSATQLNRMQQCYRKHFKTKETTSRGPDMPDLTFS